LILFSPVFEDLHESGTERPDDVLDHNCKTFSNGQQQPVKGKTMPKTSSFQTSVSPFANPPGQRSTAGLLTLLLATALAPSTAAAAPAIDYGLETTATHHQLGSEHREALYTAGTRRCFHLEIPGAGLLTLALRSREAADEARLSISTAIPELQLLDQSATYILARASAATQLVTCAGRQDPRRSLGELRLRSTFVQLAPAAWDPELRDPELIEIEPNPKDPELIEIEPNPKNLHQLCRAATHDDHADLLLCATPITLGARIHGEVGNGWGDDRDVFSLVLPRATTVRIALDSPTGQAPGLLDFDGQRLLTHPQTLASGAAEWVQTLQAGTYYLTVDDHSGSDAGAFTLSVTELGHDAHSATHCRAKCEPPANRGLR